jgi:type I restriction-modification system DNA methylase subunit
MSNQRSSAKSSIEKLVHFFEQNIYQLKSPDFNETQARQQLIDPFFEALGWDVHNRKMNPIYLQEVIPEGRVKTNIGKEVKEQQSLFEKKGTPGKVRREYASILDYIAEDNYKASWKEAIKKPDYRFRIKGQTKFFVEAKKPFVDLSKSAEAIFQVKRYGFSGRVPVSILTDFEQLRTFDCTHKPEYGKPNLGVIKQLDLTYKQYLDEFTQLYDTFSREAVEAGSLDTLTRKLLQKKTGDFALDKHFLEDLSKWREELARDIARHPRNRRRLTDYTLNESVQRILDRIVFFRVCEDREIEVENTLLAILRLWQGRSGVSLYSLLNDLFKQRRALYNGLLFAPHECEELEVGDEVLLKILEGLNYPFSPYYFNEIGVEILGSIYEKFLGKTIHLTPKTVRIEEKPEVRKAGGVYYTPQYIVNYIVDNTVGKLLYEEADGDGSKRKPKLSPKRVAKLKIIDIACGSGSFLLGAFQKLIDYHIEWYREHPKNIETQHNVPDAYDDGIGNLRLSSRKKRDILLNNIYGVDIDRQAVEVTQMSLYLKVLEGENAETLNPQMTLALKEAYLPTLTNNIKCGNSLIGTDFSAQTDLFDSEATQKINPFDWVTEFAEIVTVGGFDAVIGNPPYVRQESLGEPFKKYVASRFRVYTSSADLYAYFVEKAHLILKRGGLFGMICSNKFMRTNYGKPLRSFLSQDAGLLQIIDFGELPVFEGASTFPAIIITKNGAVKSQRFQYCAVKTLLFDSLSNEVKSKGVLLDEKSLTGENWTLAEPDEVRLLDRLGSIPLRLNKYLNVKVNYGVKTGLNDAFIIDEKTRKSIVAKAPRSGRLIKPFVIGDDVRRYSIQKRNRYLILIPTGWTRRESKNAKDAWAWLTRNHPGISNHLKPFARAAMQRSDHGEYWWELRPCDYYSEFEKPKIIWPEIAKESRFTIDTENQYLNKTCFFAPVDDKFLLGIMNSKVVWFFLKNTCSVLGDADKGGRLLQQKIYIDQIPIRAIDPKKPAERQLHDNVVALVETTLDLHVKLNQVAFDSEKEPIQRQIAATDKKIDKLVYELYGLTEEEIKIVEGSAK